MAFKKQVNYSKTKSSGTDLITEEIRMNYAEFRREKEESIRRNSQLIDTNHDNPQALFARGCARKHLTKYQLAIEDFSKVIKINDKHAASYYKRCLACLALGHYNQALNDADKYLELCPFEYKHLAYFNRAVCYMKMNSFEKAYDDFTKAIELEPSDVFYRCCRARIAQAKVDAKRQSNQICKDLLHPITSYSFFTRAMALQEYGLSNEAFHCFENAFKRDPMNIEAFFQIGIYHADLNEHKQAIDIFNQSLELLPDDSRTLQYRGMSYAALGNNDKARKDFDHALSMNQSAIIYFERGLLHFRLGYQQISSSIQTEPDTQLAIKDMTETTKIDPTSSIGLLFLALANGQENLLKDGLQTFDRMIENNLDSIGDEIKRERKQLFQRKEILSDWKHELQHQNNDNLELKEKVFTMEKDIQQLHDQLETLSSVRDKAEILRQKIEKFKEEDIRLYRFYQRLIIKTEEIFIAFKAIASSKVDTVSGGGKLDMSAKVTALLGQTLSFVPALGSTPEQVLTVVSSVLAYIDKERQTNIATRIANMFTMFDIWYITEDMAIDLTEKYHSQILEIFDEPPKRTTEVTETKPVTKEKKNFLLCCGNVQEIPNKILAKEESYMSERVAEYAIALLVDGLVAKRVSTEIQTKLSDEFVKCVCTGEDLGVISAFKDPKIETTDKTKKWNMNGFFRKVGIRTKNGDRYGNEKVDTDTYGFRIGTQEEADKLELKFIDTEVNQGS